MAGLRGTTPAQHILPTAPGRALASTARRTLPNGPCNYRDVTCGSCGCDQFWDKTSAELHDESEEHRSISERSTYCVCGHHACFHLREVRSERTQRAIASPSTRAYTKCDGHCQLHPASQCNVHRGTRPVDTAIPEGNHAASNSQMRTAHGSLNGSSFRQDTSPTSGIGLNEQGGDAPSQSSAPGLPRIPSICLMSHDRRQMADNEARNTADPSRQSVAGLGLSMLNLDNFGKSINRPQSASRSVADDANDAQPPQASNCSESELPSTRANSTQGEQDKVTSPRGLGPLDQVLQFNRNLALDMGGDTIPNTYNMEDFIQSATEVATPSNANTPDLGAADQAVHEGKKLIETLTHMTSNPEQPNSSDGRPTSAPPPQLLLTNSPSTPQEQLENLLRTASPPALHKLISYLGPLHNLLNSIPNVANTITEMNDRLALLESNNSFNHVQPEDLQQQYDMFDGRILELENRMDEHDKIHQAIDADQSSGSQSRRRVTTVTESFDSNQSLQSNTSSAMILAAMDRKETDMEIGGIKERLDLLEAAAMPTSLNPWEVEVVFLPWGSNLRGIWFPPEESMHDSTKATTQDSEEWTQAQNSRLAQQNGRLQLPTGPARDTDSSPPPGALKASIFSDTENGWSSQAISDWASGSVDWLFPKACGSNNLVYKRLKSRGLVRNVTLRGASARDIQATLAHAFGDLTHHLKYTEDDKDPIIDSYPALKGSFIPLRKVMKESKLRFLTPAEMSSSALWSAQFLSSGVLMRVSGGKKRLYVTQREAYMQEADQCQINGSWTWQELRELPRHQPNQGPQMDDNEEHCQPHVPEADAKEACWAYVEAYDAPPVSVHSSFGSHHSVQLSMRPADREWRRSITPSSILKNRHPQPISPLSENHPHRPGQSRNRTVSASILEPVAPVTKRRIETSPVKPTSAPQLSSRASGAPATRMKRRRVTNSSSPVAETTEIPEAQATTWNYTPRYSREPPSPFFSSIPPAMPRANSDVASRPSQRSAAVIGKGTPFAYATPHSGPFSGGHGAFGDFSNGGDTEPEELFDDDNDDISWRGVTDGEADDASSTSDDDAQAGAQEQVSFSGDDSGFGSEGDDDSSDDDAPDPDEESEPDIYDSLLDVIEG